MSQSDWNTIRDSLEHEIRLTRELLSNLHQEEISLMLQDKGNINQILEQRSVMLERLSSLRVQREQTTKKLVKITGHTETSLEKILPPFEEITAEILSLSDQLLALTQRLNRQHTQNQYLNEHPDRYYPSHMQIASETRAKRKASVATYHLKK